MASSKPSHVKQQKSFKINPTVGNSPPFGNISRKCKFSSVKGNARRFPEEQQISRKNVEEEEISSSPVLGRQNKSMISTCEGVCSPDVFGEKKRHLSGVSKRSSPSCRSSRVKHLVFSGVSHPLPREIIQRNLMSPSHKRIKSNRSVHHDDISPLRSPVGAQKAAVPESPSTAFMNKDDSLLESIDFDALDSICSSMMSTPKSSASSRESKRTPLSEKSSISPYGLRITPQLLVDKVTSQSLSKSYDNRTCNKSALVFVDTEHANNISIHSTIGEFGDPDSPDLFEVTPSAKNHAHNSNNEIVCPNETEDLCDDIGDIFEDSFGIQDNVGVNSEVQINCKGENFGDNRCRNLISDYSYAQSKTSDVPEEHSSVVASSFVSPITDNHGVDSVSLENVSSCDSQTSFTSTIDSQPLIGRLQGRLKGLQSSQPSEIQTEKERRVVAVAAAVEEAEKVHTAGSEFELGPFFGLPSMVAEVLKKHRGIMDLYEWQKDCIAEGCGSNNLLFSLPTSGGKTLVAEILMLRQLLLRRRDVIFILPYVALVQEKVHGLSPFGVELGFLIEEYAGSRGNFPPRSGRKKCVLYIATIEKASGLVNSLLENKRIQELGLVVADEVHMLGEGSGRGATLEGTLTKLRYAAPKVQLVAMSATIGNLQEISTFLDAKLYTGNFRPIELSEYVKMGDQIWELNSEAKTEDELLCKQRLCCFPYTKEQKQLDSDMIGGLVGEVVPEHSCLVFCPTRRNCETLAELICRILPKDLTKNRRMEKVSLYRAIVEEGGGTVCPTLRKTLPFGVAYHHSGLTEGERRLIEEGYLVGTLCCLCCTSTLAAGVNLPARRVIIRSPYTGSDFLNRSRYKQMVGRAGRAGLDTCGESFLVLQQKDIKPAGILLLSPMDVCHSTLLQRDDHGLIILLFSSLGLGVTISLPALRALVASSLLAIQSSVIQVDLEAKVLEIVENLRKRGLVHIVDPFSKEDVLPSTTSTVTSDTSNEKNLAGGSKEPHSTKRESLEEHAIETLSRSLTDRDVLSVSRLGRAAIKGNIDLDLARRLYSDLIVARESLAVNSHLHLLYLVVPYDIASNVKVVPDVLYKAFLDLGEEEIKVAKLLGITEAVLIKLTMGQKSKKVSENVLQRFYVALILHQMWLGLGIWEVSEHFHMHRGFTQQLLLASSSFASCIHHFCQELEELWAFRDLLSTFSRQLSGCCSAELLPLLDLPAVKKGRAKMMFNAGYRTLHDVANADARALVESVEHLPYRTATQIINSAKMLLLEKAESLQGEAEEVLMGLHQPPADPKLDAI